MRRFESRLGESGVESVESLVDSRLSILQLAAILDSFGYLFDLFLNEKNKYLLMLKWNKFLRLKKRKNLKMSVAQALNLTF